MDAQTILPEERLAARNAVHHISRKLGHFKPKIIAQVIANSSAKHHLLKIDGNKYGDRGASLIAEALKTNSGVLAMDISENEISLRGAQIFAEMLRVNNTLQHLKLEGNPLSDTGVTALADALRVNRSLVTLHLNNCDFGVPGVTALADMLTNNSSLVGLHISGSNCGDEGAEALGRVLGTNRNLKTLSLYNCRIGDAGGGHLFDGISRNSHSALIAINLARNRISLQMQNKIYDFVKQVRAREGLDRPTVAVDPAVMERVNQLKEREKELSQVEQKLKEKEQDVTNKLKSLQKEEHKSKSGGGGFFARKTSKATELCIVLAGDSEKEKLELVQLFALLASQDTGSIPPLDAERNVVVELRIDSKLYRLTIVNTPSDDKFSRMRALQYEQADVAIIVFSVLDTSSFDDIEFLWYPEIKFISEKSPLFLIGTQPDKRVNAVTEVSLEQARQKAAQIGASSYFEVSARDVPGLQRAVEAMAKEGKKKRRKADK